MCVRKREVSLGYMLNLATDQTCNRNSSSCISGTRVEGSPGTVPGWGGKILGLSPSTPVIAGATIQCDLETRVGVEIGEGPEETKCTSLRTLCRGRW